MAETSDTLLEQALRADDATVRREAFVQLVGSSDWRMVLAPHVVSCQGYRMGESMYPDWTTFHQAAAAIAEDEDKIQRALELAGARFSGALLTALARRMREKLVEPALTHLRTAEGMRASLLQRVLHEADPAWVQHPLAAPAIRRQLRTQDYSRVELMHWLADAGNLGDFIKELREVPPTAVEEWSAVGKAQIEDEQLYNLAMATMPHAPAPVLYLMRLDPLPEEVLQRVMASARSEWVSATLEVAILDGLDSRQLIPLAEIGVRLGGRSLAAATAWVGASKLAKQLLIELASQMRENEGRNVSDMLWIRRQAPSADRALEQGRRGESPDLMDAAALIRQLRGAKVIELVREILGEPRDVMIDAVLRPLCAVNEEAAREVMALAESKEGEPVGERARAARQWADIAWPPDDTTQEIPLD